MTAFSNWRPAAAFFSICATLFFAFAATSAEAQGRPQQPPKDSLTVGVGAAVAPRYIGANSYGVIPFPTLQYQRNGRTLRTNQFGFEADLTQ